jgi:hypothetical protein
MLKSYIEYWDDSRDNSVKVIEAVVGRDRMVGVKNEFLTLLSILLNNISLNGLFY